MARRLKAGAFRNDVGPAVNDDHLPLNGANIPAIDLIDFRPPPTWHMSSDLPERCSAASLEQVGKVVTAWLSCEQESLTSSSVPSQFSSRTINGNVTYGHAYSEPEGPSRGP